MGAHLKSLPNTRVQKLTIPNPTNAHGHRA